MSNQPSDLGFEADLFKAADRLRGNLEPSEYKHVVLGLVFLKYISEAFEGYHAKLAEDEYADAEDPEEYLAENIFWVPQEARWSHLRNKARDPNIGKIIDDAMEAIERVPANEKLKGVLPKNYARPTLNKEMLGDLIDLFSKIDMRGDATEARDLLGRVYEYFLSGFASSEGKRGGEFFTPRSVVKTLVSMLEPKKGRVYDPCCGSGGMFIQSENFIEDHGGRRDDISVYGQEINHTTWRLAMMNLAVQGIDAEIKWNNEGSFIRDELPDLRADYILANPPFNISDWGGERLTEDARWKKYGTPPKGNANYAWLQHILHHLAPRGTAGVVLANGSMSSQQSGEGDIRKAMNEPIFDDNGNQIGGDVVDCMVALPGQLFYSTQIPACLWILANDKSANGHRDRRGEVLFIDARQLGYMVDRVRRDLDETDIDKITDTYNRWRSKAPEVAYKDEPGFCASVDLEMIRKHDFVLTPGRYVGAADEEDDGVPFEEKLTVLRTELAGQFDNALRLQGAVSSALGIVDAAN
jgi:type I restriction enzyme M protein